MNLHNHVSAYPLFNTWNRKNSKRIDTPIVLGLLLLGSLYYLGRRWTMDDLEETTAISRENHRVFIYIFLK